MAVAVTMRSHLSGSGGLSPALTPLVPITIGTDAANAKDDITVAATGGADRCGHGVTYL